MTNKAKHENLKVAIVHDWAYKMTGGEKVLEVICEMFPQADVFMMMGDATKLSKSIQAHKITFSFIQKIPFINKFHRYTYFLWPIAIESFNFNQYDLVISSSACAAKGVITGLDTKHVCYMHTPMRYAWDMTWTYFNPRNFSWWKRLVIPFFLTFLRVWDFASTARIDTLAVNSTTSLKRVKKYYRRDEATIVYPPVYVDMCKVSDKKEDYFVSIAPFEPNKRGDLVVEVAKKTGIKLKIIGKGSLMKSLQKSASGFNNIEFLGFISEEEKFNLISRAKGLFFVGIEDFGIVPVEAIASGTPVIAYAKGGALDTVIDEKTGVLFYEQSVEAIEEAIKRLDKAVEKSVFNVKYMRKFVEKFSKERFINEMYGLIENTLSKEY